MNELIKLMIEPALRRVGTLLGTYTATLNLDSGDTATLQAAIPIVIGLVFDLAHSHIAAKLGWK
jgi:hypothetical protein